MTAAELAGASLVAMLKEMRDEVPRIPLESALEPGADPAAVAMIERLELILNLCGEINAVHKWPKFSTSAGRVFDLHASRTSHDSGRS